MSWPRLQALLPLAAAATLLLQGAAGHTQSLSFRGDLLSAGLGHRPALDSTDTRSQALLYQYVRLAADDLVIDGVHIELVGVLGAVLGDEPLDHTGQPTSRFSGDVLVGVLRWESKGRSVAVSVGRQYLFAGGGRAEHLDGASLTYRLWYVDLTLFGGRTHPWQWSFEPGDAEPSEPTFASYAVGARARLRLLDHGVAAVSFLHEGDGAETARQLTTFDLGSWRWSWFEALAGGVIDMVDAAPQELWTELIFRPLPLLKLSAGYAYMVPGLAISKTSLFSVFSTDAYHDASVQAYYGFNQWLMAGLEGGARIYPDSDEEGAGYWVALRARVALDAARHKTLGLRAEYHDAGDNRYLQGRLFALLGFLDRRLYLRADAFVLGLFSDNEGTAASAHERAINDNPLSIGGLGLIGWRFATGWNANVAGSAFSTPRASSDLRLMARLTYQGHWSWR